MGSAIAFIDMVEGEDATAEHAKWSWFVFVLLTSAGEAMTSPDLNASPDVMVPLNGCKVQLGLVMEPAAKTMDARAGGGVTSRSKKC